MLIRPPSARPSLVLAAALTSPSRPRAPTRRCVRSRSSARWSATSRRATRLDADLVAQNGQGVLVGDDCRVSGNTVRLNTFAGVQMAGLNCGYGGNVLSGLAPALGGFQLAPNLCNGAPCP